MSFTNLGRKPGWRLTTPKPVKMSRCSHLPSSLGISAEEILYFGDSLNDLPVFNAIAHPVAVGNARPEVLDLAWQTTLTNNVQGVAHFLAAMFDLS